MANVNDFYRGYIALRDKSPIGSYKDDDNLVAIGEVRKRIARRAQSADGFAGVLAEDTILVDFDDPADAEIALKIVKDRGIHCRAVESTRGLHLLFRNNGTKPYKGAKSRGSVLLACGLHADIKQGPNQYEVLCKDGDERRVVYDNDFYDQLSPIFWPIKTEQEKSANWTDFKSMGQDTHNRNEELHRFEIPCSKAGLTNDEIREALTILNEYVFADPLPPDECAKVLREEAFPQDLWYDGTKLKHEEFAKMLAHEYHFCKIKNRLYYWNGNQYINAEKNKINGLIIKNLQNTTIRQRNEIVSTLMDMPEIPEVEQASPRYIGFENGMYDLETDILRPFTPDIILMNHVPWDYNIHAQSDLLDSTLNKVACGDKELVNLLLEMAGYGFYQSAELQKAFILSGSGANGKSVFLDMLLHMYSHENVASLSLAGVTEKFTTAELENKLANLGADISGDKIPSAKTDVFKGLAVGDQLKGERKGEKPFFFSPTAVMVFSANRIPVFEDDEEGAALRRLIVIPFDAKFSETDEDYDPQIKTKLRQKEVIEALIFRAVQAFSHALEQKRFSDCKASQDAREEYVRENDDLCEFFEENQYTICNHTVSSVYDRYVNYCNNNGIEVMSKNNFSRILKNRWGINTKNSYDAKTKKTQRFYAK